MSFSSSASAPAVSDPERLDKWCSIAQGRREFIDGCRMERDPISGRYLGEVPAVNIVAVECDSW